MPRPRLTRLFATAPLRFESLGIAVRLGISCVAVLVLVMATTYYAGQSSRRATERVAMIESLYEPTAHLAQDMVDATSAFNQTVLELANPDSQRNPQRVDAALGVMTANAQRYRTLQPDADALVQEYLAKVAAHELRARELLLLAERRRSSIQQYWRSFNMLDRAVHDADTQLRATHRWPDPAASAASLTQALGRVQDTFGAYASAGGKETERAVADSEAGFRQSLDGHARVLQAAYGAAQLSALSNNFESVIRTRRALVGLNNLIGTAAARFHETSAQLDTFTDKQISEPARRAFSNAAVEASAVASDMDKTLWQLGLLTLSILLLISAATAYGVIIPVRRLIAAIRDIASGQRGRRVELEGGVHELDTLAAAFNDMSSQLEQAESLLRHYQGQLETRVDERTRQLDYLAHHDPLTRLPNRRQLAQHLNAALAAATDSGTRVGVLFMDLDNFKTINDTLGHETGDALLNSVGARLTRDNDSNVFIARLGGDEFTIIYRNVGTVDDVTASARDMIERFQATFDLNGRKLTISTSIGAAVFPDHAQDAASLLRAADAALARAKESGRNRCSVYGPELLEAAATRFQIEQDLRQAIAREEFELFYQPVMNVETLKVVAVEALLRWRTADGNILLPARFIDVAERSGLIAEISEWVLETAARQAAEWSNNGWPEARIAINVSSQQLLDATFHMRLEETLTRYALTQNRIEIELTETALQTGAATIDALHWLRSLGVGIALDDFGTGYSSLTSLQQLPITRVKLDRSLIQDVDDNPRSASVVRSIIRLTRSLGLSVTVEGVERRSQLALLRAQIPLNVQGFLISRAVRITNIAAFVAECERAFQELSAAIPVIRGDASVSDSMIVRQLRQIASD